MSEINGKIIQVIGPVVDIEFEEGHLPDIYSAIRIPRVTTEGVQNELIAEVPKDRVPENIEVGQMLQTTTPQGPMNVVFKEINEDNIVLDANHPLSGKNLIFELANLTL